LKRGFVYRLGEFSKLARFVVDLNCSEFFVPAVDQHGGMAFFMKVHACTNSFLFSICPSLFTLNPLQKLEHRQPQIPAFGTYIPGKGATAYLLQIFNQVNRFGV
jgi:hypothetical protein